MAARHASVPDPGSVRQAVKTQSPWVSRLLEELGHEVVAKSRRMRAITGSVVEQLSQSTVATYALGLVSPFLRDGEGRIGAS